GLGPHAIDGDSTGRKRKMKNEERGTENEELVSVLHSPFSVLRSSFTIWRKRSCGSENNWRTLRPLASSLCARHSCRSMSYWHGATVWKPRRQATIRSG